MRIYFLLIAGLLLSSCSMFQRTTQKSPEVRDVSVMARGDYTAEPRKRVMVLPFLDVSEKRSAKVGESARIAFLRSLAATKNFVLVSPSDFPREVSSFVNGGEYDLESMAKIAESLGLALILEGKIYDIKAKRLGDEVGLFRKFRAKMDATVRVRVVAARNGREIINDMRKASVEATTTRVGEASAGDAFLQEDPALINQAVTKAFRGVIGSLIRTSNKLSWEGRVAMVQGNRIYLNAGRMSGLQVGDILKVTGGGEEIFDPETGDLIGLAPGPLRGTLELVSYFGKDGAIAVIHSGSGFKENDMVEIY